MAALTLAGSIGAVPVGKTPPPPTLPPGPPQTQPLTLSAPPALVAPAQAPSSYVAPPTLAGPAVGPFTGTAPTPTPYGAFSAPDPATFAAGPNADPSFAFRLKQGQQTLENSAAARGTLLTGATAKAEQDYGQNAASQEYQNAYERALGTYTTNRDTNQLNFGQQSTAFGDQLAGYNATTGTALSANAATNAAKQTGYLDSTSAADALYGRTQSANDAAAAVANANAQAGYGVQTANAGAQVAGVNADNLARYKAALSNYYGAAY